MPSAPSSAGVAHAGQLQQLRGVDRAAAEDHLAGRHPVAAAPTPVLDPGRPGAVEGHLGGQGQGAHGQVGPVHDRVQVGPGRGQPPAAVHVAVEPGEALLAVAVDVVGERVAGLLHGLEERAEQRVGRRAALQHQRPAAAAPLVGAGQAGLHALEVGQAVRVAPALHALVGGPALVVQRVAPLEDHPVDAGRAAEHLAAGVEDLAGRPCAAPARTRSASRRAGCRSGWAARPACG